MKRKVWQKILAVFFALLFAFVFFACGDDNTDDGNNNDSYGDLEDFFKDYFDDWENSGTGTEVDFTEKYGDITAMSDVGATLTKTFDPTLGAHRYEAEFMTLKSPALVEYTAATSFRRNVGYLNTGAEVTLDVTSTADTTALLVMAMSCGSGGKFISDAMAISYASEDGSVSGSLKFGSRQITGNSWNDYNEFEMGEVELKQGKNTVHVASLGGFNLDYMRLIPPKEAATNVPSPEPLTATPAAEWEAVYGHTAVADCIDGAIFTTFDPTFGAYRYEAENAELNGFTLEETAYCVATNENSNASGGRLVYRFQNRDSSYSRMLFNIDSAADCVVLMRMGIVTSDKFGTNVLPQDTLTIFNFEDENGFAYNTEEPLVGSGGWLLAPHENTLGEVRLHQGRNLLVVDTPNYGDNDDKNTNIDYITLTPVKSGVTGIRYNEYEYTVQPANWETEYAMYDKGEYVDGFSRNFAPTSGAYAYEAEKMTLGDGLSTEANASASDGNRVVGFGGESRTLSFNARSEVDYTALVVLGTSSDADFNGSNAAANTHLLITHNGANAVKCSGGVLKGGENAQSTVGEIRLKTGDNRIEITVDASVGSSFSLDYFALLPLLDDISVEGFTVAPALWKRVYGTYERSTWNAGKTVSFNPAKGAFVYEAEDAQLGEGLEIETGKPGASGNAQLGGFGGWNKRTVTFTVESEVDYTAIISFGMTSPPTFDPNMPIHNIMKITYGDGQEVNCSYGYMKPGDWNTDLYTEGYVGEISLKAGTNTVVFEITCDFPSIPCFDYMLISPRKADVQ